MCSWWWRNKSSSATVWIIDFTDFGQEWSSGAQMKGSHTLHDHKRVNTTRYTYRNANWKTICLVSICSFPCFFYSYHWPPLVKHHVGWNLDYTLTVSHVNLWSPPVIGPVWRKHTWQLEPWIKPYTQWPGREGKDKKERNMLFTGLYWFW